MGTQHVKATESEYQYFSEHKGEPGVPIVYKGNWLDPVELEAWRLEALLLTPKKPRQLTAEK